MSFIAVFSSLLTANISDGFPSADSFSFHCRPSLGEGPVFYRTGNCSDAWDVYTFGLVLQSTEKKANRKK